jgi:hypothetical protein
VIYYSFDRPSLGAVEVAMWKPWEWAGASQAVALANARNGATELSRRRVEREDVEIFLAGHELELRSETVRRVGAG